jgi:hypothetical protein
MKIENTTYFNTTLLKITTLLKVDRFTNQIFNNYLPLTQQTQISNEKKSVLKDLVLLKDENDLFLSDNELIFEDLFSNLSITTRTNYYSIYSFQKKFLKENKINTNLILLEDSKEDFRFPSSNLLIFSKDNTFIKDLITLFKFL